MQKRIRNIVDALDRPVVLVGMMGSGKTRIGQALAHEMGLEFLDADHRIEEISDHTIPEIFAKYGEEEFRRVEKRVIQNLIEEPVIRVISLGGGAILNAKTAALVKDKTYCVWVQAPLDQILQRVSQNTHRPLLACEDPQSVLQKLMEDRTPYYQQADCHIMNKDGAGAQAVQQILSFLTQATSDKV